MTGKTVFPLHLRSQLFFCLSLFCAGFLLSGCSDGDGNGNPPRGMGGPPGGGPPPSVEVVQAQRGTLPLEQRLSGTVQARNQVTIVPEIAGRVEEVYVDNGDYVQRGQVLARINARQQREQLRQAEASLEVQRASVQQAEARLRELEVELRSTEQLAAEEFVSSLELERLRAQVEAARADLSSARAQVEQAESTVEERRDALSETTVRAPVNGQVGRRNAEIGMRVDGSSELFVVGDLSQMHVRINLTEDMLRYIETGQRALIWLDHEVSPPIEAEVSRISPFLESGSFSTEARIDVGNPDGQLRAGMYVDVDVLYGESEEATLVPNSALHEDPRSGRMGVFVAPELREVLSPVPMEEEAPSEGISDPTPILYREVEVIAQGRESSGVNGLESGEWVVAVGQGMLNPDAEEEMTARTRPIAWNRLLGLQELQSHDLLRQFMEKQQRLARSRDTAPSDSLASGI